MATKSTILLLSFWFCSCNHLPHDVRAVLLAAGDNRPELEDVIDHYRSTGEKEKLKAAYFLIGNMEDKFGIDEKEAAKYNPVFDFFGSLRQKKELINYSSPFARAIWDSLELVYGPYVIHNEVIPDYKKVKAAYLIEHINLAFAIRDSMPWGRKISFDQFCENILSYRFSHEPLERWLAHYHDKNKAMTDSFKIDSIFSHAKKIHKYLPLVEGLHTNYPFDLTIYQMETAQLGTCNHISDYEAKVYRSAGLPVAIDFAFSWGNHFGGHSWNALILENGNSFAFEGNRGQFAQKTPYSVAKIYRKTFSRRPDNFHEHVDEIPSSLIKEHMVDVTSEYARTSDIEINLSYPSEKRKKYAVICSFGKNNWIPQDWGELRNGKAVFKKVGVNNLFLAMYYDQGMLSAASDPFILNDKGEVHIIDISENKKTDMVLLRKYPIYQSIRNYQDEMLEGSFQGANHGDFKDAVKLYTITASPNNIETAIIKNTSKFRYVRFSSPYAGRGDVAELEFFGGDKGSDTLKLKGLPIGFPEVKKSIGTSYQNAFDGNIDTYFNGHSINYSELPVKPYCWAGLDLKKPRHITKIRYCPRSDTNFIIEGDRYELRYWKKNKWISMGEQVAIKPLLDYKNVPSGGLYLLHNLSRGKEERIFTYEDGQQMFW